MKEPKPFTDSGGRQVASAATQLGLADKEPFDQNQPKIVVVSGRMTGVELVSGWCQIGCCQGQL